MVLDRAGDEHDPLAQQPRINVEAAFAPVGLLDDDWDELRNEVLMIHHGNAIPWDWLERLHRAERRKVQALAQAKGGPIARTAPPCLALT